MTKLTDARTHEIGIEAWAFSRGLGPPVSPKDTLLLVEEVIFLRKLIADLGQEGARERYEAGRQAGALEMKELAVMMIRQEFETSYDTHDMDYLWKGVIKLRLPDGEDQK